MDDWMTEEQIIGWWKNRWLDDGSIAGGIERCLAYCQIIISKHKKSLLCNMSAQAAKYTISYLQTQSWIRFLTVPFFCRVWFFPKVVSQSRSGFSVKTCNNNTLFQYLLTKVLKIKNIKKFWLNLRYLTIYVQEKKWSDPDFLMEMLEPDLVNLNPDPELLLQTLKG